MEKDMISGKGFNSISSLTFCPRYKHHFNYDTSKINENEKVFLNLDYFNKFLKILINNPPSNKFILITHNSDKCFTHIHYQLIEKYVNKIYAINNIFSHPNVTTIPLV